MKFHNFKKEFCIETNASLVGLGAVLSQSQDDSGVENRIPVAYASRLLSKAGRNYGITDLKGLAVSWAISHFKNLYSRNAFYSDYRPLSFESFKDKSILTGRLLRRAEKLLEYDFDIIYCSGKDSIVPDFLSRIYLVELTSPIEDERDQEIA